MKLKKTAFAVCVALGLSAGLPVHADQEKSSSSMSSDTPSGSQILSMHSTTVDNLTGKEVVNAAGDQIGEVDSVVRSVSGRQEHAVVSVGGFLGIGDKQVTIPLKEMQMQKDALLAPIASTEDELKTRSPFNEADYTVLHGEETVQISQGMSAIDRGSNTADESTSDTADMHDSESRRSRIGFGTLDLNQDGYLNKDEADGVGNVSVDWDRVDTNQDGRLDRAEFSALEAQAPADTMNQSMPSDAVQKETTEPADPQSNY